MSYLAIKLFNISKKILARLILAGGLVFLAFLIIPANITKSGVIFLDVGQGDSSLIKTPSDQVILIDGGPDNTILRELGKNMPFWRRRLDLVIISHYHDDHIVGLIEILKRYQVKTLAYSGEETGSILMRELLSLAAQRGVRFLVLEREARISLGPGCSLDLLNPAVLNIKEDSNNSLAARLDCSGQSFLFAGDNNEAVEQALLASGWNIDADIFKAAHHGSNTSNSRPFLERVGPRLVVVSVGQDNRFGHPGALFLGRAATQAIPLKRTDQDGSVRIFLK